MKGGKGMEKILDYTKGITKGEIVTALFDPDEDGCISIESDGKEVTFKVSLEEWGSRLYFR
jgi:hypothetical protein